MSKPGKGQAQLKFGRYNALTKLGQGAMATVYLAEDPSLNRMVAIKVIHSHLSSNASLLDRFTVEAKTAASLRNPNIVEIFDYGLEDGAQYLVMEYIDGPNLQFVLNLLSGQPMAPELCAAIICQAADGLITAEKFNVVHRDIKPENMMFKSEGVLKIADFGIAHISEQNLTQTGSILGSPNFMSPEQVEGKKPSHMTDMFSLGAVFYYCLSGRKPFSGANIPTIMRHICDLPHAPLDTVMPDPDPFLAGLVDTLLAKEPENRGKGARWLSQQLRGFLNQKGLLDLTEATKDFLETTGKLTGNSTMVDLTPAPGPDEPRPKAPLKPGMKAEKQPPFQTHQTHQANPAKPGTGIRPGTGASSVRPGTWQAAQAGQADPAHDYDFSGTRPGSARQNLFMWIGAGAIAIGLLAAALFVVMGTGGNGRTGGGSRGSQAASKPPQDQDVASVSLQPGSMELQVGQKRKFIVEIQPAEAPAGVRWESENPTIASIQDGEVWGRTAGQTRIRAVSLQDGSKQGSAEVIVAAAPVAATANGSQDVKPVEPIESVKPTNPANPTNPVKPAKPIPPTNPVSTPGTEDPVGDIADKFAGKPEDKTPVKPVPEKPVPEKPAASKAILTVTSAPPFAEVIVDGRFMGTTPVKDKELAPGKHKVQISHRSFPAIDTVVNLGVGEKTLRFRLFR
jgi:serine/threonine protein kinase